MVLQQAQVTVNGQVLYTPTPKQLQFHLCEAKFPLYGGAAAGGKSHALRWHYYLCCLTVPNFRALLLRRNLPDLRRTHARECNVDAGRLGATWRSSASGAGELHFPNGSFLELGHCTDDGAVSIYLSSEYDGIGFDELVTFTEFQYLMIRSRARTTKPNLVPQVRGGTNPGGIGGRWVRARWIDKDLTGDDDVTYRPDDYAYIPATLDDNPHIQQEQYNLLLSSLPPQLAKAYRDGDWDIFEGQFFSEFRKDFHVQEFDLPPASWRRVIGMDWGYAQEGAVYWGVVSPDGQLLIEDEFVFNGERRAKRIAPEVADVIKQRNEARGLQVRTVYADPAMFSPYGHTGETMADTFAKCGVPLTKADNDRINGWARLRAWLRPMPTPPGEPAAPWMVIHPRCTYLIRTLPQLVMDQGAPEDVDTRGPDHGADALRYLVMGRPAPTRQIVETHYPEGTMGYYREQILSARRRLPLGHNRARRQYAY